MRLLILLAAATLAHGQRVPVVAELFTSEGCNSCPPADLLLQQLDRAQPVAGAEIVVLSEHVDYWNQLGWRDPFSSPQFTARQQRYSRTLGGEVYTPQLVIDGREQILGSDAAAAQKAIARAAGRPKLAARIVSAKRDGADAAIVLSIPASPKGRAEVWIAIADESGRSSVLRGENAGRELSHVAIVRRLVKAGAIGKSEGMEKVVRVPAAAGPARVIVFLADDAGAIHGAAQTSLP